MKDPCYNDDDNFVMISYEGKGDDFWIEKRFGKAGEGRNWEDESQWEFLGLASGRFKRYHLTAEQAAKFKRKD
jgi:hypothetical protein